jgi:hypothetical protein
MKIVAYSNFDSETVNDVLVADNITNSERAETMLKALNDKVTEYSTYYFKIVPDDYKLYVWEP